MMGAVETQLHETLKPWSGETTNECQIFLDFDHIFYVSFDDFIVCIKKGQSPVIGQVCKG